MYKSPLLDDIRKRIDALDNEVHDRLLERADLVMQISEEKKKNNIQIVQPAREARMIRRLMARHRGPLPQETIVRIWRELVGSISLLQTGLSVSVLHDTSVPDRSNHYWDMARDYFGSVLPMVRGGSAHEMLADVYEGRVNFAVLPYPVHDEPKPWWTALAAFSDLKIIQKLPYGAKENFSFEDSPALVVAKAGFDTSDDDHSLILIKGTDDMSRARIVESLQKISLTPLSLFTHAGYFLAEVKTYLAADDERLIALQNYINEPEARVMLAGGFPTPLQYKD